jgi:CelD/BcsL family acetyltransferase involved in cellulose biosynthesis
MNQIVNVQPLELADHRWLTFAASHPNATVFHHPAWTALLARCYGYRPLLLTIEDAGTICAGLPISEIKGLWGGRRWVSLPFSDYCQPLGTGEGSQECLAAALVRLYETDNLRQCEVRWTLPSRPDIQQCCRHVLQVVPISPDAGRVYKGLDRTCRQNIAKAEESGVQIVRGQDTEHLRLFYELQLETRRRHGVPVQPWRFFRCIGDLLLQSGLGFVLLAFQEDRCIAGALLLHWGRTLTCKYAASRAEDLKVRPNNLLFWTAIQWGCEQNYTTFDMGRTEVDNTGLRRYKKGWGAEETPLTYSILAPGPVEPANEALTRVVETVIQRSPPWVCRAAGEALYKHFA